jgi:hypothetical protein
MNYPNPICTTLYAGGSIAVGTAYLPAFKCPSDALGGGLTVVEAGIASREVIAIGSSPTFELVKLNSASLPNGTIGTVAAGAFTAGTVKALTIDTDSAFVDAGEHVAWKVMGTAVNAAQVYLTGYVNFVPGK